MQPRKLGELRSASLRRRTWGPYDGDAGDDFIKMVGDTDQDFVNCGEDADGTDVDRAEVSGNDLVDGTSAGALTTTAGLSCEVVVVDGVPVAATLAIWSGDEPHQKPGGFK